MSNVRLWDDQWDQPFELDGRLVDPAGRRIEFNNNAIEIEPRVMAVLIALAQKPGETVRRQELIDLVWSGAPGAEQSLNNAISLLRRALQDTDASHRLIRTAPKLGYQLCAHVVCRDDGDTPGANIPAHTDPPPSPSSVTRYALPVGAVLSIVAIIAAALFVFIASPYSEPRKTDPAPTVSARQIEPLSIAVLPFENFSAEPENEFFADGLAEEILHALSQIDALKVASRTDSFQFKNSAAPVADIAARLGVANILEGSVRRDGDNLRITAQLISAESNAHLWSSTYDRPAEDILTIQQDIAVNIANALFDELTESDSALLAASPTTNFEAYESYLIGKHELRKWTPEGNRQAVQVLERAVALDPEFAEAQLALGRAYYFAGTHYGWLPPSEAIPKVKASLVYGVSATNPVTRAAALSIYGDVLSWSDKDWRGAISAYQRAYELTGTPALGYGLTNSIIGEHDVAIEIFSLLAKEDDADVGINDKTGVRNNLAWAYFNGRRYEDALDQAEAVIAADENFADGYRVLGRAQLLLGQSDEAIESFATAATLMNGAPVAISDLSVAFARAGRTEDARAILQELERSTDYVSAPLIAQIYANLGDADMAFQWLEKGVRDEDRGVIFLKINPLYDPIRQDPRFSGILAQLNLAS